jgi:hypothetical protein
MEGLSGTVPFEEIKVKNRALDHCRRYNPIGRRFGRRMRLAVSPDFAMTKDFFNKGLFLDKRDNSHFAAALRTFQRINFINALD